MTPASRPKAYSYVRFSTPEQAKGDSLRRQVELAQAYPSSHSQLYSVVLNSGSALFWSGRGPGNPCSFVMT
jgi:hypothetical protein